MDRSQNNYAEQAVLALALDNSDSLYEILGQITDDDFSDNRNKLIYQGIMALNEKKITVELTNLLEEMTAQNTLDEAGGETYIKNLMYETPLRSELPQFLETVKNRSVLRHFLAECKDILKKSTKKIDSIPDFIGGAEQRLAEIAGKRTVGGFAKPGDILNTYMSKLEENVRIRIETGKDPYVTGVPSGYPELDRITGGFKKGEVTILAARPSVGKTAIALNFALNAAKSGVPTAFFSLEMSSTSIVERMLCNRSYLSSHQILGLNFQTAHTDKGPVYELIERDRNNPDAAKTLSSLKNGIKNLSILPIYIDDKPGGTAVAIMAQVKKLQSSMPDLGLVIIDYLTLIESAGNKTSSQDNRQNVVASISRALKGLARDLNIPLIVLAQLNRDPEKRTGKGAHEPVIADIRDSGQIEQDADMVFLLYRPDYYQDNKDSEERERDSGQPEVISKVKLRVAKHRNGPTGEVYFMFDKEKCIFSELQPETVDNEDPGSMPGGF